MHAVIVILGHAIISHIVLKRIGMRLGWDINLVCVHQDHYMMLSPGVPASLKHCLLGIVYNMQYPVLVLHLGDNGGIDNCASFLPFINSCCLEYYDFFLACLL